MDIFKRYALRNLRMAKAAVNKNDAARANRLAQKAVQLDKNLEEGWLILAATSANQDCIDYLNKALEINPESEKAQKGLDWALSKIYNKSRHPLQSGNPSISPINARIPGMDNESFMGFDQIAGRNNGRNIFSIIPHRWQSIFAVLLVVLILTTTVLAPVLAPLDDHSGSPYFKIACERYNCIPEPPSNAFPLGTVKEFDVYHTLIWGTRQSLIFGLSTAVITALIGTLLGAVAAYSGGWLDRLIMRICDAFLAFPIIAAVALFAQLITLLSPDSLGMTSAQANSIELNFLQNFILHIDPILLALILFSWMPYARIIHTQVLQVKQTEYIEAAQAVGARHRRIIWKHILPNSLSPAVVMGTRDIGRMVVIQASLTFIGVGGSSAWATILNTGKDWIIGPGGNLFTRWWIYLPITLAVVFFGVSWSLMGDEVNHWLNPKNI